MDPLILLIEPDLDERAAAATMSRAQRVYEEGARDISRVMRDQITEGTVAAGRGFEELETKARRAYLGMQDAGEKVAAAERKYEAARERGASNTEALARRVERARLDEIQAIERATTAYRELEGAAQDATRAGEQTGNGILSGLRSASSGFGAAGSDMADGLLSGFGGAGIMARMAGFMVPGVGWAAAGVMAGKVFADNVAAGLQSLQTKDLFQSRLGVDDGTMAQYGASAGKAYTDMWGASVEDNLRAVQFGVQAGVIAPGSSDAQIQQTIAQMQTLATVMEVDVQEAARAAGQLMRGGFAADGTQAADIIASGFQNGLDIAGDWLDTITEYSTQFRKLGLDGGEAIGLIQQGLVGGARDSDKVADSLKEFSIRAVDGSELTAQGFAALGFQADEMAQRFLAGGDSARTAFDVTLRAIQGIDDPIQQALTWTALFGTQWEDMGDAINNMDLSKARTEFGNTEGAIDGMTNKLSEHSNGWDGLGRQIDVTFGKLQEWLADTTIGKFFGQGLPNFFNDLLSPVDIMPPVTPPTNPHNIPLAPDEPLNPLDILAGGSTAPRTTDDLLMPGLNGPPPPGGPAADAPVPGARTPILTDTQQKAADEAEKAAKGGGESLPDAPQLPLQYSSTAGLPTAIANATTRLDEARHAVAEKEARLNQLRQSNVADANDIQKAENDLTKANQARIKAEQALTDSRIKATEQGNKRLGKLSSELNELGNQLDADFGLSKGLGGVIENAVKALGNALAAPFLQALGMVANANPNEGSGMVGILAANGAFGSQYTPGSIAAASAATSSTSAYGGAYGVPAAGGNAAAMMALAQSSSGKVQYAAASDLVNGLADCSGSISDLVEVLDTGQTNPGRLFTTTNFASDAEAAKLGFLPGYQAGALNVGVNPYPGQSGHMAATLPNGVNFEGGGGTGGGAQYGGNAAGALDPQFEKQYYRPLGIAAPGLGYTGVSPGLPTSVPGGGGWYPGMGMPQSPVFGGGTPGVGSAIGQAGAPAIPATPGLGSAIGQAGTGVTPGTAYPSMGGNSGNVLGGLALDGAMAATAGLDMMAPGAGAAAKIGIQLANRTIGYGAQNLGILGSGALETLSLGDNPKGTIGASWLGKGLGGIAGAAPALPNLAGQKPPGPMEQAGGGQQGGNTTIDQSDRSIHVKNEKATEDQTGKVIAEHQAASYAPAGKQ